MLGIIRRAQAIIVRPQAEWPAVAQDAGNGPCLRYVAALAAIPALARFAGGTLIGGYASFRSGFVGAVVSYALAFAIVYAVALLVDMLAPRFGGKKDFSQSLRLVAYSFTPAWLAGFFLLVPGASFLTLLGLYGFYLIWTGLPVLKQADRALPYALLVLAWTIVLEIAVYVALPGALNLLLR